MKWFASKLEVSPRTISNWKSNELNKGDIKIGRPCYTDKVRLKTLIGVAREIRAQGYVGWRRIEAARPDLPTRLIQEYLRKFKLRRRKNYRLFAEASRKSVVVQMTNAIWTEDGAHVGNRVGKRIETQVLKDRGSLKTIAIQTGSAATAEQILTIFKTLKEECGSLPLVISTDNGSMYCNKAVEEYLKDEKVIHLKNLPRTPQHNASAEIAVRELKEEAMLDQNMVVNDVGIRHEELVEAVIRMNNRIRSSKKFKSANKLDDKMVDATTLIDRDLFYSECLIGIKIACALKINERDRRMLERGVIYSALEKYGAIKRTGGGWSYSEKQEIFL